MQSKPIYLLCIAVSLVTAFFCGLIAGAAFAFDRYAYTVAFLMAAAGNVYNADIAFKEYRKL